MKNTNKNINALGVMLLLAIAVSSGSSAQNIAMIADLSIVESKNEARLSWSGINNWPVSEVEYRLFGKPDWKAAQVTEGLRAVVVDDLNQDTAYEWRLVFHDGVDLHRGPVRIFRTYAILDYCGADNRFNTFEAVPSNLSSIQKIYNKTLQFSYEDNYQLAQYVSGEINDEKGRMVSRIAISRNNDKVYSLELSTLKVNWKLEEVYHLKLKDDFNPDRSVFFQISEPSTEPIETTITINPIYVDCSELATSLIEYYGEFNGGHAPYRVTWTVASAGNFLTPLTPPKETVVSSASSVPVLTMDYPLDYLVVMTVDDGCGNFGEYAVVVRCQLNEDGESSLLFERIEYDRRNNRYWPE